MRELEENELQDGERQTVAGARVALGWICLLQGASEQYRAHPTKMHRDGDQQALGTYG